MDQMAERAIIKAIMNGYSNEVADAVPFFLFQTEESKQTVKQLYNFEGTPTFNTIYRDKRFNTDFLYECEAMNCDLEDIPYYANRLKLAHIKKLAREHIDDLYKTMDDKECTLEGLVKKLRNGVDVVFAEGTKQDIVLPEQYADDHYQQIVKNANNPDEKKSIRFKQFPQLDSTFYGLKGGDLILICAQSGHGKTATALNIVDDLSVTQKKTGYYANAEMTLEELTGRIVSKRSNVPATEILSRQFKDKDAALTRLALQYDNMKQSGLILSRIPIMSVATLRSVYRKLANSGRAPEYILVDYIGRMEPARDDRGLQEWQRMYLVAEELKTLAVELDVPVIALAQLNEDGKIEGAKKIKNACDGVLFFEPITEEDEKYMSPHQKQYANYRIEKYKVRRNDNSKPIYINFAKDVQSITEVF